MIDIPEEKLVQKFVDAYHETQECIDNNDYSAATTKYSELLDIYKEMAASKLDPMHKELAYDQLVKVYGAIQNPPKASIHATTHIIAAAILLMLFSFMVFFRPAVFGAVTATMPQEKVVQDLNWAFIESESRNVHLEAVPKSLSLTGKIDGNGFVRVYAVTPNSRRLVFDNDLSDVGREGKFSSQCVSTCNEDFGTSDIQLDIEVQNAAITIYSIEYTK